MLGAYVGDDYTEPGQASAHPSPLSSHSLEVSSHRTIANRDRRWYDKVPSMSSAHL